MAPVIQHIHLVLGTDTERAPVGFALNADVEGAQAVFLCVEHAASLGRAANKVLRASGKPVRK